MKRKTARWPVALLAGALWALPAAAGQAVRGECRPTPAPPSSLSYDLEESSPGLWAGTNAAHRLEALFNEHGVQVVPARIDGGAADHRAAPTWSWSLSLARRGSPGALREADGGWPLALGPSVDLPRTGVLESFLNSRKGIRHRLRIDSPGGEGVLLLEFVLGGSLSPKIASDGQSIVFTDPAGAPLLAWRSLRASGADGRDVPVRWDRVTEEDGVRLLRLIVESGAGVTAPVTVQGLIVSPKRAAAASASTQTVGMLSSDPSLAAPSNDTCGGADVVPAAGPFPWTSAVHDITGATTTGDPATPTCQSNLSRSIWFRFTPSGDGVYTFSLCADAPTLTTVEDTVLALYSSTGACTGLLEVSGGCDDDTCSAGELQSVLTNIALTGGTTYYVVAWKYDGTAPVAGSADVQLRVSQGSIGSAPANDQCAGAAVIPGAGPFPSLAPPVSDITHATTFGDPPAPSCQATVSRSIWYSFTPSTSGSYSFSACADAGTGTTVDDTVMALYAASGTCSGLMQLAGGCDDDGCAVEPGQSVITGASLTAGATYYLVVWQFDTSPPAAGNTAVQVKVSQTLGPGNDTCGGAIPVSLDSPVAGTTAGAVNDLQLPSGSACFTGVGQTVTTAPGGDAVYRFTAPAEGSYSFRVTGYDTTKNAVLYVSGDCPAGTPGIIAECLGASNRNVNQSAEEVMCLPLTAGQQVYLAVDETAVTAGSAFTLEVNRCARETEPNGTVAAANILDCGVEGSASPINEADFYALGPPPAGSRVFALVDGVAGNANDFDLRVTTSADTIEYDDNNNDLPFGGQSANIAGAPLTGSDAYLRVNYLSTTIQAEPYRLYGVVQRPASAATTESEPNNSPGSANSSAGLYFSGALSAVTDVDHFGFSAQAGELLLLGLDLDPLRDNTPFNGTLALLDGAGTVLLQVNDGSSSSTLASGAGNLASRTPAFPAESLVWRVRSSGTYIARISTSSGAVGDYLLSIARDCRIGPATNLSVSMTDAPDPVAPGGDVVYTVMVSNTGGQPATSAALRVDPPAGAGFVSAVPSQGGCSGSGPVSCALGTLAAGASATVDVTVTAPGAPGPVSGTARASAAVIDTNRADDVAQQGTTVGSADSDGDGVPDAGDCAPIDPGAWSIPGDATDLIFPGPGTAAMQWTAPLVTGGPGLHYDMLRSVSGGDFSARTCVVSDQTATSASDADVPSVIFFYLLRSENVCGGSLGAASNGTPHTAPSCP